MVEPEKKAKPKPPEPLHLKDIPLNVRVAVIAAWEAQVFESSNQANKAQGPDFTKPRLQKQSKPSDVDRQVVGSSGKILPAIVEHIKTTESYNLDSWKVFNILYRHHLQCRYVPISRVKIEKFYLLKEASWEAIIRREEMKESWRMQPREGELVWPEDISEENVNESKRGEPRKPSADGDGELLGPSDDTVGGGRASLEVCEVVNVQEAEESEDNFNETECEHGHTTEQQLAEGAGHRRLLLHQKSPDQIQRQSRTKRVYSLDKSSSHPNPTLESPASDKIKDLDHMVRVNKAGAVFKHGNVRKKGEKTNGEKKPSKPVKRGPIAKKNGGRKVKPRSPVEDDYESEEAVGGRANKNPKTAGGVVDEKPATKEAWKDLVKLVTSREF
ncbi:MAG: hypothetical protein MMC33_009620 [Icmadophila ericetorum]|nr:hypothetical protein [Icmadophila ericetorum]